MDRSKSSDQPLLLERRAFLKMGAGLGLLSLGWANPAMAALLEQNGGNSQASPRSSARNCLLIVLRGGPSHVDTFDIKTGPWTPQALGVEKLTAGYFWPMAVMPQLANRVERFSIVRSLQHQEVVHERAQYFLETGRRLNPGLRAEIPHISAVLALEQEQRRTPEDIFPSSIIFNFFSYSNNGFLSASYSPFTIPNVLTGITNLLPRDGLIGFERRRAALQLVNEVNDSPADSSRQSFPLFQQQAEKMMRDPITGPTFSVSDEDMNRYGKNRFGISLAMARNLLKADRGVRFIEVDQYGWDHHFSIYKDIPAGLFALCKELDQGLSVLLDDLTTLPGTAQGKSLLDETIVVVIGEFGRTVGNLNSSNGRDHYPYAFSGLLAGGGVKGGRVVGETDSVGASVLDPGWNRGRPIHMPDLVTTIYSAMGIDWTKTLTNTPSGRVYRYADPEAVGDEDSYEIDPLF
jgi:hypothetical protein